LSIFLHLSVAVIAAYLLFPISHPSFYYIIKKRKKEEKQKICENWNNLKVFIPGVKTDSPDNL